MDLVLYLDEEEVCSHKTADQIVLWLGEMCPRLTGCFDGDWHRILAVWQSGDFTIHFLVLAFNLMWHGLTKLNNKWWTRCYFEIKVSSNAILLFQVKDCQSSLQVWLTENTVESKMLNTINSNLNIFRQTQVFKKLRGYI